MDLTHDDVVKILKIIDEAGHLDEVELDFAGLRLHVRRGGASDTALRRGANPVPSPAAASARALEASPRPVPAPHAPVPAGAVAIRAPMLGTFYRAPAPGEKPFVEIGARVSADDTVCLIEVMKLFNSLRAGVAGTVVGIAAENGSVVEYDQPLVFIMPATGEKA